MEHAGNGWSIYPFTMEYLLNSMDDLTMMEYPLDYLITLNGNIIGISLQYRTGAVRFIWVDGFMIFPSFNEVLNI